MNRIVQDASARKADSEFEQNFSDIDSVSENTWEK